MKGKHGGHKGHHHGKHHHRAEGGGLKPEKAGPGGNPEVFKEAEERKHGGRMKKKHHEMHPEGHGSKHRHDRPRRKSGGRVGSDKSPLSSAHHSTKAGDMAGGQPD